MCALERECMRGFSLDASFSLSSVCACSYPFNRGCAGVWPACASRELGTIGSDFRQHLVAGLLQW